MYLIGRLRIRLMFSDDFFYFCLLLMKIVLEELWNTSQIIDKNNYQKYFLQIVAYYFQ